MTVQITPEQLRYLHFLEAHKVKEEPVFANQNQAYKRFGRSNVERWANNLKVKCYYRGRTIQYKMAELLAAAENQQDYLLT